MKHLFLLTTFLGFSTVVICQNIGIGTTSPKYKLHLHSTGHTTFNITDGTTGDGAGLGGRIDMLTGQLSIFNYSGSLSMGTMGKTALFVSSNIEGFLGINNSDPKAQLHVSSNPDTNEGIRLSGATPYMSFYNGTTMNGYIQAASGGFEIGSKSGLPFNIYTGNTQRMTILNNGNIGIGTTSPQTTFHVEGTSSSNGILFAKNNDPNGWGVYGQTDANGTSGSVSVVGINYGNGVGVGAMSNNATGYAIQGISSHGKAAWLITDDGTGLEVHNRSLNGKVAVFKGTTSVNTDQKALVEFSNTALTVSGTFPFAFQVTANGSNSITIPNTSHANSATDMLFIQHKGVAANVNTPVYVAWNGTNWMIYTESGGAIPAGEVYNVLVIKQ